MMTFVPHKMIMCFRSFIAYPLFLLLLLLCFVSPAHAVSIAQGSGGNFIILEDKNSTLINLRANLSSGEPWGGWSIAAAASHGVAQVVGNSPSQGQVRYRPDPDFFGSDTFVVQASNLFSASASYVVNVTVTAVNDQPTITLSGPVAVDEDAGLVSIDNFATFDPGAANESGQKASFTVESDRPELFTIQPFVNSSGRLRFGPRPNRAGVVVISVFAVDDGGDLNGGNNTSLIRQQQITINPVGGDVFTVTDWASAGGSGVDWNDPMSLQAALEIANNGDEISVAGGWYLPTVDDDRRVSFIVPAGVRMLGGYEGAGPLANNRDPRAFPTILSGDIGDPGDPTDNSYHILTPQENSELDGFTIRDGFGGTVGLERQGAGAILFDVTMTFRNCIFTNNSNQFTGGAVAQLGDGESQLINCIFENNSSSLGGAFFSNGGGELINSIFIYNTAGSRGSAVYVDTHPSRSVTIESCTFLNNSNAKTIHTSGQTVINNSILWQNSGGDIIFDANLGQSSIAFSIFDGELEGFTDDGNNITNDPLFQDETMPAGRDAIWFTPDDGLLLEPGSPGLSTGKPSFEEDILGANRPLGVASDRGAYESIGVVYVDRNAGAGGDGSSWEQAFDNLQLALDVAGPGDEIWVTAGVYLTDEEDKDRDLSFILAAGAGVYGGFTGEEVGKDQRDWRENQTILSGDIGDEGVAEDNAYTVVQGSYASRLDGLIIQHGYANDNSGPIRWAVGGGLGIFEGEPMYIRHVIFRENAALGGSAIAFMTDGFAPWANSVIESCVFSENSAIGVGFGLGTIYADSANHNVTMNNCLMHGNDSTDVSGIALRGTFVDCNHLTMVDHDSPRLMSGDSLLQIRNSILWSVDGTLDGVFIDSSIIQGGFTGNNIFDKDPDFFDPGRPEGADGRWFTADDGLRLRSGSVAADTAQLGSADRDLLGQPRPLGGSPDMGAYEGRLPVLRFITTSSFVSEASGTAFIPIDIDRGDYDVDLAYQSTGGIVDSGSVEVLAESSFAEIILAVPNNSIDEPDRSATVSLTGLSVSEEFGAAILTSPTTHVVTIGDDDDPPEVSFTVASSSASEAVTSRLIEVGLTGPSGRTVQVEVNAAPQAPASASDFTALSETITFSPGQTSRQVLLTIVDDHYDEMSENVVLSLSAPSNAFLGTTLQHIANINDDDTAGVSLNPVIAVVPEDGSSDQQIAVTLDAAPLPGATVRLTFAETDSSEVAVSPTTIDFTETNWLTPQQITITGVDDTQADGNIISFVTVSSAVVSGADPSFSSVLVPDLTITTTDNDGAGITVQYSPGVPISGPILEQALPATAATVAGNDMMIVGADLSLVTVGMMVQFDGVGANGDVTARITAIDGSQLTVDRILTTSAVSQEVSIGGFAVTRVILNAQPTASVNVNFNSNDGSEGVVTQNSVTIIPANWNVGTEVRVVPVNDPFADGNQDYELVIGQSSSSDATFDGIDTPDIALQTIDDDTVGVIVAADSPELISEAGTVSEYTLRLASKPTSPVAITVNTNADVLANGQSNPSFNFDAFNWDEITVITLSAVDDSIIESVELFAITMTATSSDADYNAISITPVNVSISDNDSGGIQPSLSDIEIIEAGDGQLTVVLSSQPSDNVNVALALSGLPGGVTVAPPSLVFTAANWDTPQVATLAAADGVDYSVSGSSGSLSLTGSSIGDSNFNGAVAVVNVTVLDDDAAGFRLVQVGGNTAVSESGDIDTYQLSLTTTPSVASFVIVSVDAGEGLQATPNTVVFTAADWEASQEITVSAVNDAVAQGSRVVTIEHVLAGSDNSGDTGYSAGNGDLIQPSLAVTVTDDDDAGIIVSQTSGLIVTEAGGQATVSFRLSSQPQDSATVTMDLSVTTDDTAAPTVSPGSIVFDQQNWSTPQLVTMTGVNDNDADGNQSFVLTTSALDASDNDTGYEGLVVPDVTGTIIDDDSASVILSTSAIAVAEGGSGVSYTIQLATRPTAAVTVAIDPGPQVSLSTETLVFSPATWNTPQEVTVTALSDEIDETNPHPATIGHSVTGGDYTGIIVGSVAVSITDAASDIRGVTITEESGSPNDNVLVVTENAGASNAAAVSIVLESRPTGTVSIAFSSNDTSIAVVSPPSVTFTPTDWDSPQVIEVSGVDDAIAGGTRLVTVVTAMSATDPGYNILSVPDLAVTVSDDDSAGAVIVASNPAVNEDGSTATIGVRLASQPTAAVTVPVSVSDANQGSVSPGQLEFTPATWDIIQNVTVTGADADNVNNDTAGNPWVEFDLQVRAPVLTSGDNAYDSLSGVLASEIIRNLAANAVPTLDQPSDQAMIEDLATVVTLTGISAGQSGEEVQSLTLLVTSSNSVLLPDPVATPHVLPDGSSYDLSINPASNQSGSTTITITLTDDASIGSAGARTVVREMQVTVTAVDDPPVVDANGAATGLNNTGVVFIEDAGPVLVVPGIEVSDVDTANLLSATVTLAPMPDGSSESLALTAPGFSWAWSQATATLTMTGAQTVAGYQAALRSMTYQNSANAPDLTPRVVSIVVSDGTSTSTLVTSTLNTTVANDAPVLTSGGNLDAVPEDTTAENNAGTLLSDIIDRSIMSDGDGNADLGLALVVTDSSNGQWQYTADGTTWSDLVVSASEALLVSGSPGQAVRFIPDANYVGSATLTVRAWDLTSGSNNTIADVSTNGSATAFSATTAAVTVAVTAVNDRPTIAGNASLAAIPEDVTALENPGTAIASLLNALSITDADLGALRGVAITGSDVADGFWEFSTDAGISWLPLAEVTPGNALLLADTSDNMVRFQPNPNFAGEVGLILRAWDQSAGNQGTYDDSTGNDAWSREEVTATLAVTPVNDAPTALSTTGIDLFTIPEDVADGDNTGTPVARLIDGIASDIDALSLQGIAITAVTGTGVWQWSTNSGSSWNDITTVSTASALLLSDNGTVLLRYQPANNETGARAISYRIWDRTAGTVGELVDVTTAGGTTAFSLSTVTSQVLISSVLGVLITQSDDTTQVIEGGSDDSYTIVLQSQPSGSVTVTLLASNAIVASPIELTFTDADWDTPQEISVSAVDDLIDRGGVVATINHAFQGGGYDAVAIPALLVDVTDNDVAGLAIGQTSFTNSESLQEGGLAATTTVALTSQPSANVTVDVTSSDSGEVTVSPGSLSFTPQNWNQPQPLTLAPQDDAVDDDDQTVAVTLDVLSADAVYDALTPDALSATVLDDDQRGLVIAPSTIFTNETGTSDTLQVRLASQPTDDVSVSVVSSDTSEGVVSPPALTFSSSNWSNTQAITVTGVDDFVIDSVSDQEYTIILTATGGDYQSLPPQQIPAVNQDDDQPAIISDTGDDSLVVVEAGADDSFSLRLSVAPSESVVVTMDAGVQLLTVPSSVIFSPSNWQQAVTVSVQAVDDAIAEGGHSGTIAFNTSSSDSNYNGLVSSAVPVQILDNDNAGIVISGATGLVTREDGQTDVLSIVLTSQPTAEITIGLSSNDTSEIAVSPASLIFTGDNWNLPQAIIVTGVDDAIDDGDQSVSLAVATPVSSDAQYADLPANEVAVQNRDDDTAAIIVLPTSGLIVSEAGQDSQFTITLASQPTNPVTIDMASNDTSEATVSTTVVLDVNNWQSGVVVPVQGVDDGLEDPDQPFTITLTVNPATLDGLYQNLDPDDVIGINIDNDSPGVLVATSAAPVAEGDSAALALRLTVAPAPGEVVSVTLASSDDNQLSVATTIQFNDTNWNVDQVVQATVIDDQIMEGQHTARVTYAVGSSGGNYDLVSQVQPTVVVIADNDTAGVVVTPIAGLQTDESGTTDRFTLVLTSQPTSDVTITVNSTRPDQGQASPAEIVFTALNWDQPQAVVVTGQDVNQQEDGDVPYLVELHMANLGTDGDVFYQTINPADVSCTNLVVDNAPTLDALIDLTIPEDAGSQVVVLTGISNGQPLSETEDVTVSAQVTAGDASLISSLSIAYATGATTGELTFDTVPELSGSLIITVSVDDGNQVTARAFELTISPSDDVPQLVIGEIVQISLGESLPIRASDDGDPLTKELIISVSDVDNLPEELIFTVILAPKNGNLLRGENILNREDTFTAADIAAELLSYAHNGIAAGGDGFAVRLTDGANTLTDVVELEVSGDVPPELIGISSDTLAWTEGDAAVTLFDGALVVDTDQANFLNGSLVVALDPAVAGDRLSYQGTQPSLVNNELLLNGSLVGTLSGGADGADLVISLTAEATIPVVQNIVRGVVWQHPGDNPGDQTRTITCVLNDGRNDSDPVSRQLMVTPVNDAPRDLGSLPVVTTPGIAVGGQALVQDPEGDTLLITIQSLPSKGEIALASVNSPAFTYTPFNNVVGADSFVLQVSDGQEQIEVTIAVTISGVDGAPRFTSAPPMFIDENASLLYEPVVVSTDGGTVSEGTLNYSLIDADEEIGLIINATTGALSWPAVPGPGQGNYYSFGILVVDTATSSSAYQAVLLKVTPLETDGG